MSKNYGKNLDCLGVVFTMVTKTLVCREAYKIVENAESWSGKRFKHELPQRIEIAGGQKKQQLILDLKTKNVETAKLAIVGITRELLERLKDEKNKCQ